MLGGNGPARVEIEPMRGRATLKGNAVGSSTAMVLIVAGLLSLSACRPAPERPPLETAQALFDQSHYREARIELMGALQRAPEDAKLHMLNARIHLALLEGAEAEASVRRARELGVPDAQTSPLLAEALLQQEKAEALLTELGAQDNPAAYRMRGEAWLLLRDPHKAQAEFDGGLAKYPKDAPLLTMRATLAMQMRQISDAQLYAKRAVAADPQYPAALLAAGDSARAANNLANSRGYYEAVLKLNPDSIPAKIGKMKILAATGDTAALAPLVDELAEKAPDHPDVIILKARQLVAAGDRDAANRLLREKSAIIAKHPGALMTAGEIALQQNYLSLAIDRFEQLLRLTPDNPKARYWLARAYVAEGDGESARRTLAPVATARDIPADLRQYISAPPTKIPAIPPPR